MNNGVDSKTLVSIAHGCIQLKVFDIAWCEQVGEEGIYEVLLRCALLEKISIVGAKKVTEKAFPVIKEYYDAKKSTRIDLDSQEKRDFVIKELHRKNDEILDRYARFGFYQNLLSIDATKCDSIPDEVYLLLLLIKPNVLAKNYYGENVQFPSYGAQISYM